MSNTAVENEVVRMQFDNRQFEAGVKQSMSTLDKLKAALHLDKSAQGFKQIGDAAKKVNFNPITNGIEGVKRSFSAMDVAFATAVARMTNDAITAGKRITSALTIDPIKTGLQEYETKINAIQVMRSNTTKDDVKNIVPALDDLNKYADKTIYNFTQMTNNVGKFIAQGMKAQEAANAVKGLANLAGASGATAEDMARATYQMSQAMGGTIRKIDWNSLRNANMATVKLKQTLMEVAKVEEGIDVEAMMKKKGVAFEDTLEEGWLSGKLFTEAMQMYSNAYSEAELKAKGYNDEQIKRFKELAAEAEEATTSVKTLTQLWDVLKETAQSGWTQTWDIIIGDFDEAKSFFTSLNNAISPWLDKIAQRRNNALSIWKSGEGRENGFGGREELMRGLYAILTNIYNIIRSIAYAFRDIFPRKTGEELFQMTKAFREFAEEMRLSDDAIANVFYTFRGLFSIFGLVRDVILEILKLVFPSLYSVKNLTEVILKFTGYVGNVIYVITKALRESGAIQYFIENIADVLKRIIGRLIELIGKVFVLIHDTGLDEFILNIIVLLGTKLVDVLEFVLTILIEIINKINSYLPKIKQIVQGTIGGFVNALKNGTILDYITGKFNELGVALNNMTKNTMLEGFGGRVVRVFKFIGGSVLYVIDLLLKFIENADASRILSLALTVVFGVLLIRLTSLIGGISKLTSSVADFFTTFSKVIKQLKVHNPIVLELAIFVGTLTASIWALSKIPSGKIWNSVAAISALAVVLGGLGLALTKLSVNIQGLPKMSLLGMVAIMLTLTSSINNLSKAMINMSKISIPNMFVTVINIGILMTELMLISVAMLRLAPKATLGGILMLAFCSMLSKAISNLAAIDYSKINQIGGELLAAATIIGASAALLGFGLQRMSHSLLMLSTSLFIIVAAIGLISKINVNAGGIVALIVATGLVLALLIALKQLSLMWIDNEKIIKEFTKGLTRIANAIGMMAVVCLIAGTLPAQAYTGLVFAGVLTLFMTQLINRMAVAAKIAGENEKSIKNFGKTMMSIAAAMSILTIVCVAVGALVLLPGGLAVLGTAVAMMGLLTLFTVALMHFSKEAENVKMGPVLALMAGLTLMMGTLIIMAGINWVQLLTAAGVMGLTIAAVRDVFETLKGMDNEQAIRAAGLTLSLAILICSIGEVLIRLTELPWQNMLVSFVALEAVIMSVEKLATKFTDLASKGNDIIEGTRAALIISASIAMLAGSLYLAPGKIDEAAIKVGSLLIMLLALVKSYKAVSEAGTKFSLGVEQFGRSLLFLGIGLSSLIPFIATIGIVMNLLSDSKWYNVGMAAVSIVAVAGGLMLLAKSLTMAAPSVGIMLGIAAAAAAIGIGILAAGAGINQVATAILKVSKVVPLLGSMALGFTELSGGITLLAAACIVMILGIPGIMILASSMTKLGSVNVLAVATGIYLFADALDKLNPMLFDLMISVWGLPLFAKELNSMSPNILIAAQAMDVLVERMIQFIKIKDAFIDAANNINKGITSGINNGINAISNSIDKMTGTIVGRFKSNLGIHSPSKVFITLAGYCVAGYVEGINAAKPEINESINSLTDGIVTAVQENDKKFNEAGTKAGNAFIDQMSKIFDSGKNKVADKATETGTLSGNNVISALANAAKGIIETSFNIGQSAGRSFAAAMNQEIQNGSSQIEAILAGYNIFKKEGGFATNNTGFTGVLQNLVNGASNKMYAGIEKDAKANGNMSGDSYIKSEKFTDKVYTGQYVDLMMNLYGKKKAEDSAHQAAVEQYLADNNLTIDQYLSKSSYDALKAQAEIDKLAKSYYSVNEANWKKYYEDKLNDKAKNSGMSVSKYFNSGQFTADLKNEKWNNKSTLEKIMTGISNNAKKKINGFVGYDMLSIDDMGKAMAKGQKSALSSLGVTPDGFWDEFNKANSSYSNLHLTGTDQEDYLRYKSQPDVYEIVYLNGTPNAASQFKMFDDRYGRTGTKYAQYNPDAWKKMGYQSYTDAATGQEVWYKAISKTTGEVVTANEELAQSFDTASDSMEKMGETAKKTESEMETFTKALNSNLKSAMNYFDEFKYGTEEDKISKKDLLKNLEDQHNGMISWAKDMQELASRGMSKDLWKNLAEEGPASYAKVKAFLDMTASELQQANDWFSRDLALPDVTTVYMQQLLGSYYGDYSELFIARGKSAGEDLNKGTKEGLEKNLDETKAAAESAGSQVADKYTHDGTGEGSPSWKTRQAGEFMNLGLIEGLKNNLKMVLRFAAKCGDTIVKMYSRNLDPKLMRSVGKSMMVGLINGITSETNHLFRLIDEITSKVPKFIKDGWGIKSPSRLFKSFGMYAMEGLAMGLSQYSTLAEAAASETADNTAKTLNGITNSVLDWDMDFNPVITPTLNLDNVTRGVREINDMFKETTLDTVVEDPAQNGGTTPQPSTTFIQNNYSPKHLASIDIYRQTRNQLSSLKGAMG